MTHNDFYQDFDLSELDDPFWIGFYDVTIKSTIQVPDDYTLSSYTTLSDEYDFTIYI